MFVCVLLSFEQTITAISLILRTLGGRPVHTVRASEIDSSMFSSRSDNGGGTGNSSVETSSYDNNSSSSGSRRSGKRNVRPNTLLFPASKRTAQTRGQTQGQVVDTHVGSPEGAAAPPGDPLLWQSAATLIVAPDVLVKQWAHQISTHISPRLSQFSHVAADRLLYTDTSGSTVPMPAAELIAEFAIVLVPFS